MSVRARLGRWIPPALLDPARRLAGLGRAPEWEYLPHGWPAADGAGWDDASVAEAQRARWPRFLAAVAGSGPLGIAHEQDTIARNDEAAHNTVMSFGYVVARAAAGRSALRVLDWGGGVGHYHVLARALVPGVALEWHVVDRPGTCEAGRALQPGVRFHDHVPDDTFDLVLASSSLQYAEDWSAALETLARVTAGHLYVTRTPVVLQAPSFVVRQRAHAHGYATAYPGWFLNRDALLEVARGAGLSLEREFLIAERPHVPGAPEQASYRGFLFAAPPPMEQA